MKSIALTLAVLFATMNLVHAAQDANPTTDAAPVIEEASEEVIEESATNR